MDPLNVTLLHLYFQNYIIIEEMERIGYEEDHNSTNIGANKARPYDRKCLRSNSDYIGDPSCLIYYIVFIYFLS
jgi:hypothetical protein